MPTTFEQNLFEDHWQFAESEHGETLKSNVRYDRYRPSHVSEDEYMELLGADVNNLTHMPLTYGVARVFVNYLEQDHPGFLSPYEQQLVLATALSHDRGEAVVTDITYSEKTDVNEREEEQVLSTMLQQTPVEELKDIYADVVDQRIAFDDSTKLGEVFNIVELLGYTRTSLRAAQHIEQGSAGSCTSGFRWIIADVFGNALPKLVEHAAAYGPVARYIESAIDRIDRAFDLIDDATYENYAPEVRDDKKRKLEQARHAVEAWKLGQKLAI
ncbi:TPA: hypothetical protein EYO12_03400 [Candidatus Saccharibacteria bacterium]|nr:hypothetical protein [Candidatus Saccharibacteria bacterium]HIO87921.1 hypothetical protein [Candidatus Saccharibacteria bacterium]